LLPPGPYPFAQNPLDHRYWFGRPVLAAFRVWNPAWGKLLSLTARERKFLHLFLNHLAILNFQFLCDLDNHPVVSIRSYPGIDIEL
jgi:hypothetical protein